MSIDRQDFQQKLRDILRAHFDYLRTPFTPDELDLLSQRVGEGPQEECLTLKLPRRILDKLVWQARLYANSQTGGARGNE